MSEAGYSFLADLASPIKDIPTDATISRTIINTDGLKAILFGMDTGQELSEHATPHEALIFFVSGTFNVKLGGDEFDTEPGSWLHMPASMPHSLKATSPATFLLVLTKIK